MESDALLYLRGQMLALQETLCVILQSDARLHAAARLQLEQVLSTGLYRTLPDDVLAGFQAAADVLAEPPA